MTKLLAKPNGERFTVKVFIAPESDISELTCDVAIYDEAENLFVLMQNLGGVGSKSLNRLSSSGIGIGGRTMTLSGRAEKAGLDEDRRIAIVGMSLSISPISGSCCLLAEYS